MLKNTPTLISFFLVLFLLFQSISFSISLDESIKMAKNNSDELAMQYLSIESSESDFYSSLQKFLPSIKYSYSKGSGTVNIPDHVDNVSFKSKNTSFSIEEDLSFHKIISNQTYAWNKLKSDKAKYQIFLNNLVLKTAETYMDVIISQENFELAKNLEKISSFDKYNASIKASLESINVNEYLGIESKSDDVTSRAIQSEMYKNIANDRYKIITKNDPKDFSLPVKFKLPTTNLNDYIKIVTENNKSIEDIKARLSMSESAKVASYSNLFLPDFKVFYTDSKSTLPFYPGNPTMRVKQLVGSLELSLYDKGDKINAINKANIATRSAEYELKIAKQEIEINAKTLWSMHHSLFLLQKSKKENLNIESNRLLTALNKYKLGNISFVDYLKIYTSFYNAKIDYLRIYKEFVINYYKIFSLL